MKQSSKLNSSWTVWSPKPMSRTIKSTNSRRILRTNLVSWRSRVRPFRHLRIKFKRLLNKLENLRRLIRLSRRRTNSWSPKLTSLSKLLKNKKMRCGKRSKSLQFMQKNSKKSALLRMLSMKNWPLKIQIRLVSLTQRYNKWVRTTYCKFKKNCNPRFTR